MRNTVLMSMGGLVVVLAVSWAVSPRGDGQQRGAGAKAAKYAAPRTAWGDPDLQGQWNSQTSTPLERPLTGALVGKETLTEDAAQNVEEATIARADPAP